MPELPEVETIRRQMDKGVAGRKVLGVVVRYGGRISPKAAAFAKGITGAKITSVDRRAKLLVVRLSNGNALVTHLKMTGRYLLVPAGAAPSLHTHVVFRLSGGKDLHFEDTRKFGYLRLHRADELEATVFAKYGPEPLERAFTAARFAECLRARPRKKLKPLLLDQSCVAGIGNIYADEGLWRAGVRPQRTVASLTDDELRRLHDGVVTSMRLSLKLGGTSSDNYVNLFGERGKNAPKLNVYGRGGKPCLRCKKPITKVFFGGRGTHFCRVCQK